MQSFVDSGEGGGEMLLVNGHIFWIHGFTGQFSFSNEEWNFL